MSNIKYGKIQSVDKKINKISSSSGYDMQVIATVITLDNGNKYEAIEDMSEYEIGQEIVFSNNDDGKIKKIFKRQDEKYYKKEIIKEKFVWSAFSISGVFPLLLSSSAISNYMNEKGTFYLVSAILFTIMSFALFLISRLIYKDNKKVLKEREEAFDTLEKESISEKEILDKKRQKDSIHQNIIESGLKENQYIN